MPDKRAIKRARRDKRQGKSASTQAGEFVREEMEHIRRGKHGARSTKQAIAIGLSKARRAGVKLKPPGRGQAKSSTRRSAASAYRKGQSVGAAAPSSRRSRGVRAALKREGRQAASKPSLAKQAKQSAHRRGPAARHAAAMKAAHTKGPSVRRAAARKAARTRKRKAS